MGFVRTAIIYTFIMMIALQPVFAQDWQKQESAPAFRGKQDDIHFISPDMGWYVNGAGKIFRTRDGGANWEMVFEKPGTFFRCVGFLDSLVGFAGNIGTDYFPNVKDTVPLYKTVDGGRTWKPVAYSGPVVKGLCAIEIIKIPYINHGVLAYKHKIIAGGRVGNPAFLLVSSDDGESFRSVDMNAQCAFILDVKFTSERVGYIAAGSHKDVAKSNALILQTKDGGATWKKVYQSNRPYEITWKASFPSEKVGYVTLQAYNPDTTVRKRFVLKTTNGGKKWKEILLVEDHSIREFGIGFISPLKGWVGTNKTGYETTDGGKTWTKKDMGAAVNKIRVISTPDGFVCYAIGSHVYRWQGSADAAR
ncbi:MAG TPA: hypothetical protein VFR58_06250 [Flavisolibacter sp.]|nr:hypothetical protein [Flavisolibacter sp.]